MKLPSATYRLQLREGVDFERAAALAPYLARLGVSHLYLSPVFTAASGSTHGYDVIDANEIEPELGGLAGLERLSAALKAEGLGLILDIVPNHMAFTVENPWLADVLRKGAKSAYVRHFDIDWHAGPLPLPWLPAPFADMVDAGEVRVDGGEMVAGDLRVPLGPVPEGDLHRVHDAQAWRLTHWRTEAAAITHRRFFTVTGLIGLRVEDAGVFEDVHRLTFDLIDRDVVQGLRVDHVDGLADPAAYLDRLRARLPETPIWVEKILTGDESIPDWPIQGTTGYVAARSIMRVLTEADGAETLAGHAPDFRRVLTVAKARILRDELPAEVERLTDLALFAAAEDLRAREWGRAAWRAAVTAYLMAFPRYRTYALADAVGPDDAALISATIAEAGAGLPDPGALPDFERLLTDPARGALRLRMQQVTGAAVAKSQEDTAFYRHVALLSANEVGGEPDEPAMTIPEFHEAMARRQAEMPAALTLTSSHDTKRSEDARARLAAISHLPEMRDTLRGLTDLPRPWGWYLAQSAFAAAPAGDLAERLPAHMEKAMREAKRDTFWTAPDEDFEAPVLEAAARIGDALTAAAEAFGPLEAVADALSVAQCALKLTIPGIPDIYQGTEIGSFRLTDPDNRAAVDFAMLAAALDDPSGLDPLDATKLSLTRALLTLRRDRPGIFSGPYRAIEAPDGILAFARGPLTVRLSVDGDPVPADGALWPRPQDGPQPVAIALAD